MIIGKRIYELRTEKGLTKSCLAKQIEVDIKAVSYWENEINEPKASYIVKLAKFFEVSTDYLLGLEE